MKTADAVAHFGNKNRLALALKIDRSAVTNWGRKVPELRARQIHDLTKGAVKFSPDSYVRR